ncbi:biotin-dependent carboxyltransferase family protein [Thalassotalea mangrovi]|uniref:Biotin-dependent carboxyltransferase n=1 Tax=Thalassotalea mangrovi TaxID=2572245 RepID=A0A4U1B2Y1_9GAMM|nr:biotin-dependent carboxyltransferase family protein [Thalassotalea mangrovi]TKB44148.1 biotin-dependent carboxyltransferase [Thalassotalea mangrovi]
MNGLYIEHPGMHTLIEDAGRIGKASLGLTTGGPADRMAFYWANRLLENPRGCAALEITYGGLKLHSSCDTSIAITGADVEIKINNEIVGNWRSIAVSKGDFIEIGYSRNGIKAYLAVKGGIQIPQQFGSCSTVVREHIGGLNGTTLEKGDWLPITNVQCTHTNRLPDDAVPHYSTSLTLRVITGYQYQQFSERERRRFFSSEYQVSSQWDRMGYRLIGPEIQFPKTNMLSEGIAYGAVQIPADGQPIILLNDRQTIGGYPKIGSVFSLDADKLGQCQQGASIRFEPISIENAHNELHLAQSRFKKIQFIKEAVTR